MTMTKKRKKTLATVLIIIVSISAFIAFMLIQVINENTIHAYTGILFGIFPAIIINSIWNKGKKKNQEIQE
jgi:hypothetical protein